MNINIGKKISTLRTKLAYTQEQLAKQCGVSSAAVSKWENNLSYPDITTLPILARIFNITIDELLNFESAIDDSMIDQFIKKVLDKFNQSYKEGIAYCKKLIHTYPNSERLKLKIAGSHGTVSMCLYGNPNSKNYIKEFSNYAKDLCKQILHSNDLVIRQGACILFSNFVKDENEMRESIQYIQELPNAINTTSVESSLYLMLNEPEKANHMLQTQLYQDCSNIMLYFLSLINVAQQEKRLEDVFTLLQLCEHFNETMQLHSTIVPQLCFQYATLEDEKNTLRLLEQYIAQAQNFDHAFNDIHTSLTQTPWFSTIELKENAHPKGIFNKCVQDMMINAPQFAFLHGHEAYENILKNLDEQI